jgi:hypothetical protein
MFTEHSLRDYPALVKALMGIAPDEFWQMVRMVQDQLPAYNQQRFTRPDRQRAVGGGRPCDQPVSIRVALVLTYLRLHVPQTVVATLFGATQADVSRELRRLLPVLQTILPCPAVWHLGAPADSVPETEQLPLTHIAEGRVLVDATEQRVSRPATPEQRQRYYSGKKKAFTLKTQFVADPTHYIHALSAAVPGATHDKKLSDQVRTLEHLPDGCEADADKGYQGLAAQIPWIWVHDAVNGAKALVPRLTVYTPLKKPKAQELTEEQRTFNRVLSAMRMRVEHCVGWVKNWAILATRFRCDHTIYTAIMQTVCGLVNAQTRRWQAARAYCA